MLRSGRDPRALIRVDDGPSMLSELVEIGDE